MKRGITLRVPFVTAGNFRILSFRSKDSVFKADPGVVPNDELCRKAGITVVNTTYRHNELSDRGPNQSKPRSGPSSTSSSTTTHRAGTVDPEKLKDGLGQMAFAVPP